MMQQYKSDNTITIDPTAVINSTIVVDENMAAHYKIIHFFQKYFLEGQKLEHKQEVRIANIRSDANAFERFYLNNHKYIGFFIPSCFWHIIWWSLAIKFNIFRWYPQRFAMPLVMILGATVAGMTSEGGGAVAFPVMTLALNITPEVARDFSLMIQSCGMTSAAFTIIFMKIVLEWRSIFICSIGAFGGIIFGFHVMDPMLSGPQKKMGFVAIWFSFAVSLFILNRQKGRQTNVRIENFNWWKGLVLLATGFAGGLCSSFAGSGVDICSFSVLTLLFRISEKVATPTSVVLMAVNTAIGFYWRQLMMSETDANGQLISSGISQEAWEYFACSVPVVVICAPLGSLLASHFHRLVLANFVYILEILALIGFLITRPGWLLVGIGAAIIAFSFIFFTIISHTGAHLDRIQHRDASGCNNRHKIVALHFVDTDKIPNATAAAAEDIDLLETSVC